jgi:hypothetical protein
MITQQGIIWGVVFPLIAAAVILLGSSLPWRRGRARSARAVGSTTGDRGRIRPCLHGHRRPAQLSADRGG